MGANAHVVAWYEAMVEVYAGASDIGISVGHIAEWYLERWWMAWVAGGAQVRDGDWAIGPELNASRERQPSPSEIGRFRS